VFVGVAVAGFSALPDVRGALRWPLLVLAAVVGVPVTLALNGIEYRLSGVMLGHAVPLWPAMRIAVLSSAANLLPVPGAVIVRTQALRRLGSSLGRATASALAIGGLWAGTTVALAGVARLAAGSAAAGGALLAAGVIGIGIGYALVRRLHGADGSAGLTATVVALEAVFVVVAALRLLWVIEGLGFDASLGQAVVLSLSGVVASVVAVFPGGLGIREAVAGGLAPLIGLPASVALAAAAVDRLIGVLVLAPIAAGFAGASSHEETPA